MLAQYPREPHLSRRAAVVAHVGSDLLRPDVLNHLDLEVGELAITTIPFGTDHGGERSQRRKGGEGRARDLGPVPDGGSRHVREVDEGAGPEPACLEGRCLPACVLGLRGPLRRA